MGTFLIWAGALPIFVFSYTCHQNIISSTNELSRPTSLRAATGIVCAVGFSLMVYIVLATAGYLTFGDKVNSDILKSYPNDSKMCAGWAPNPTVCQVHM